MLLQADQLITSSPTFQLFKIGKAFPQFFSSISAQELTMTVFDSPNPLAVLSLQVNR